MICSHYVSLKPTYLCPDYYGQVLRFIYIKWFNCLFYESIYSKHFFVCESYNDTQCSLRTKKWSKIDTKHALEVR